MNEKANYAKVVWEITRLIQEAQSLEEALRISLNEVVKAVHAETGTIWFYNKEGDGKIYPSFWIGKTNLNGMSLNLGEGIAGFVIKEGKPIIIKDCQKDERWSGRFDEKTGFVTKSMICVPLINKYEAVGCIQIINKKDDTLYDEEDLDLCEKLAIAITIVMENSNLNLAYINKKSVHLSLCDIAKNDRKNAVKEILKGINLEIKEGEFWLVIGEDNYGKAALLNIIGGIEQPTKGTFLFEGNDYAKVDEDTMVLYRRNFVGFIFQEPNLIPNLTVEENLSFIGNLVDNPMPVQEVLQCVGLLEKKDCYPSQISMGEQQKVSIARAIIKRPHIIIMDNPMIHLDYETNVELFMLLKEKVESGIIVVMKTDNEEIVKVANGVIRVKDSTIKEITFNKYPISIANIELSTPKLSCKNLPKQRKGFFFENWNCYQKLSLYSRIMIKNLIEYKHDMLKTIMTITSFVIFLVNYFILQFTLQECPNVSFHPYFYGNSFIDGNKRYVITVMFFICIVSMTIVVIYNQMKRYINQRKKELSIMQINGFTLQEIKLFICKENAILTFGGLILGNSLGIVLAYVVSYFMKFETFHFICIKNSKACILATIIVSFCLFFVNNIVLKKIHKLELTDIISN